MNIYMTRQFLTCISLTESYCFEYTFLKIILSSVLFVFIMNIGKIFGLCKLMLIYTTLSLFLKAIIQMNMLMGHTQKLIHT